jgi:PAS domain S-box-containing protein
MRYAARLTRPQQRNLRVLSLPNLSLPLPFAEWFLFGSPNPMNAAPLPTTLAEAQALITQLQRQQRALLLENEQLHAAQQALAASQARLHAAEAVAGIGSYELDVATGALHFSDGMYRLFGEEPNTFTPSLAWIDARSNPDDARTIHTRLAQAIETNQPYHYTRRIRRADGQWRTVESHGRVVSSAAGQALRLEGVVEDKTEEQHTQQALQASEEQFRLFVLASADVVYKMSADWRQMYQLVGKEFLADTRASTDSWLGNYIPVEDQPDVAARIAQAIETKTLFEHEHRVLSADGTVGWVHSRAVPMLGAQGEVLEWVGAASDITRRKEAEQQIMHLKDELARHAEDKYRTLFNAINEAFCVAEVRFDEQGAAVDYRLVEVNPVFQQQMGLADTVGPRGGLGAPSPQPYWLAMYTQVVQTGQAVRFEYHHAASGRWYEAYAAPVSGTGSRQVCAVFHDVTERKQAEEHLRQSEERLQQALSIDTVGVLFFDLHGRINSANEAFARMSGYTQEDFARGHVRLEQVTAPEFLDVTRRSLDELRAHGKITPYEKQYLRADGTRRWGLFAGKRLSEEENVKFVLDITDRKQAEQQLHAANEQLVRINTDLDNFIYTASHDLKAPISNIEGLLYLLQDELPTDVVQGAEIGPTLTRMLDAVERFKRTINHLTEVSKLQKEHDRPAEPVGLEAVVRDVCLDLGPLIEAAGAGLEVDIEATPTVSFSEKNLRSVVFNLLNNALKYRDPARSLQVRLHSHVEGTWVVLEVADNGLGLDRASEHKLFGMFQRLHDHVEGSGIGLYMVKRMVENAGGRIEVQSQLGVGSTFRVYLRP